MLIRRKSSLPEPLKATSDTIWKRVFLYHYQRWNPPKTRQFADANGDWFQFNSNRSRLSIHMIRFGVFCDSAILTEGIHYVEYRLQWDINSVGIGVIASSVSYLDAAIWSQLDDPNSIAWVSNGTIYRGRARISDSVSKYQSDCYIGVLVDFPQNCIRFYSNGRPIKDGSFPIPSPSLRVFVSLSRGKATLTTPKITCRYPFGKGIFPE
eukprot:TRINITY_DN1904_c0_g1_i2.p1 TRINITY_DN1904_c0_g1~~TRINITY_DN1904_c0_g1_i2.p1  ORF type:complete len:209 (+),score=30.55 TRINITY_DN1904_c0_g1_i2:296-922(+)